VNYQEFIAKEIGAGSSGGSGLKEVVERFKKLKKGSSILLFPHDDPDGLTSGAILESLFKNLGCSVQTVILPTYELSVEELKKNLKGEELVVIADKGTIGYYDDYTELADIVVIDHHPSQNGEIKKALVFNPSRIKYTQTSTSHLAHMLACAMGFSDERLDYWALVGMKADWAIEPATDFVCEYGRSFYDEAAAEYPNLVRKIKGALPTIFEVRQREVTTLLNQIAEYYFVISGGGFQYYYEPEQNLFAYEVLKESAFKDWKDFEEFKSSLARREKASLIYEKFRRDWSRLSDVFDYSAAIKDFEDTRIYFFIGKNVMWMPMAGSVKLYDFKNSLPPSDKITDVAFIMVNQEDGYPSTGGVHFSFRSTGGKLHLGKLASELAEALISKYGQRGVISGGGHPVAAECKTRNSGAPIVEVIKIFFDKILAL